MKTIRFREDLKIINCDIMYSEDNPDEPVTDLIAKVVDTSDGTVLGEIEYYGTDETTGIANVSGKGNNVISLRHFNRQATIEQCLEIIAETHGCIIESKESKRTEFIKTVAGELVLKLINEGQSVDEATKKAVEIGTKLFENIYKK